MDYIEIIHLKCILLNIFLESNILNDSQFLQIQLSLPLVDQESKPEMAQDSQYPEINTSLMLLTYSKNVKLNPNSWKERKH